MTTPDPLDDEWTLAQTALAVIVCAAIVFLIGYGLAFDVTR